jgi:hypothetical protein
MQLFIYQQLASKETLIRSFVNGNNEENSEQEVHDLHIEYTADIQEVGTLGKNFGVSSISINKDKRKQLDIVFDRPLAPGAAVGVSATTDGSNLDVAKWWWTDGTGAKVVKEINFKKGKKDVTEKKSEYGSKERGDETKEEINGIGDLKDNPYNIYNKAHHWGGSKRHTEKVVIHMDIRKFLKDADKDIDKDKLKDNIEKAIKQLVNCTDRKEIGNVPKAGQDENPENHGQGKDPAVMAPGPSHKGGKGIKFRSVTERECDALFFKYRMGLEIKLITEDDDKTKPDIVAKWGQHPQYPKALGVGPSTADSKERDKTVSGEVWLKKGQKWHLAEDKDEDGYITNKDDDVVPEDAFDFYSVFKHEVGHVCCFNHSGESNNFCDEDCDFETPRQITPEGSEEYDMKSVFPADILDDELYEGQMYFFSANLPNGIGGHDIYAAMYDGVEFSVQNLGPGINTPFDETDPYLTSDGSSLFFSSNRPEGSGNYDIYLADLDNEFGVWAPAQNMGELINSPADDRDVSLRGDMMTMHFSSDRPGGFGGFDIYRAEFVPSEGWTPAQLMGDGINSASNERSPSGSPLEHNLFFTSDREGGLGGYDIWQLRDYKGWGEPVNLTNLNSPLNEFDVAVGNGFNELFFSSDRSSIPGNGNLYASAIVIPREQALDSIRETYTIVTYNQQKVNSFPLENRLGRDIKGFLAAITQNGMESDTDYFSQFDIIHLINSTFRESEITPALDESNKVRCILLDNEYSENTIPDNSILIFNPLIDSKLPSTGERYIVLSSLDSLGNQILPTGFASQEKFYPMSQLFNNFAEGSKASLSSVNELEFKIKRLHFNILLGQSRIIKATSQRASEFDPTLGILEFSQAVLPGEEFGFAFEIDTLGPPTGEGVIIISVRADTGEVSSVINEFVSSVLSGIVISPNPAYDNIKLTIANNNGDMLDVKIYDALGRLVTDKFKQSPENLSSEGIDISRLEPGIYNVVVNFGSMIRIANFIKIR